MTGFGKVFGSLWTGSMMGQPYTQLVFLYMIANANADGELDEVPEIIAFKTGLTLERVTAAIDSLLGPDPKSRTEAEEGRRILRIDPGREWGWRIVNYAKYRQERDLVARRAQNREAARRYRSHDKRQQPSAPSSLTSQESAPSAEISPSRSRSRSSRKTIGQRVDDTDFDVFWEDYPRKVARAAAARAFRTALTRGTTGGDEQVVLREILDGLTHWVAYWAGRKTEAEYIPHAATWLNQSRWKERP